MYLLCKDVHCTFTFTTLHQISQLERYLARKSLNWFTQFPWSCLLGQSEMYVQRFSISVTLLFFSFSDIAQILPEYIKLTTQHTTLEEPKLQI